MATKFDNERVLAMEKVKELYESLGEEVLITNSNELCFPITNEKGDEGFIVLTFKIPKGSRDGDAYDGYAMAEDYSIKQAERKAKAEKVAKDKAKKIAKDSAKRAAKNDVKE